MLWEGSALRFLAMGNKWKMRNCEVTEFGLNIGDAGSMEGCEHIKLGGAEVNEAPKTNAKNKKGASQDKEFMVGVDQAGQLLVLLCTRDAEEKAGLLSALPGPAWRRWVQQQ